MPTNLPDADLSFNQVFMPTNLKHTIRPLIFMGLMVFVFLGVGQSLAQSNRPLDTGKQKANKRPESTKQKDPEPSETPPSEEDLDTTGDDVITVETQLVSVPVRVVDRQNRFIYGIEQSEFKVFEDGVEQEITMFSNESQPFTVALVLDMSFSSKLKVSEIQSAAISFIDQLRPEDKVVVISFAEEVNVLSRPTNDRNEIYRAIKSTEITTGSSVYEAISVTVNRQLRTIKGRKAIVFFTDGVDTTSRESNLRDNLNDVMESEAIIYPIRYDTFNDVQAMKNRPPTITPPSQRPPIPGRNPQGSPLPFPVEMIALPSDKGTTREEYDVADVYLQKLADSTGGRVFMASTFGNLNDAFSKIARELREFYSLGYYPVSAEKNRSTRKIKVKVSREKAIAKTRETYTIGK